MSIHLVVRADIEEQDHLAATTLVSFQGKDDAAIVATRRCPQPKESTAEFVCSQCRGKDVSLHLPKHLVDTILQRMVTFREFSIGSSKFRRDYQLYAILLQYDRHPE